MIELNLLSFALFDTKSPINVNRSRLEKGLFFNKHNYPHYKADYVIEVQSALGQTDHLLFISKSF